MANWFKRFQRAPAVAAAPTPARIYNGDPNLLRILNELERNDTGAGSRYDMGTGLSPDVRILNPAAWEGQLYSWYKSDWGARKIVNIPVDDMFREGWTYEGLSKGDADKLTAYADKLGVSGAFETGKRQERLFGGSVIFMGVSDGLPLDQPLDEARLSQGALRFINVVPRSQCHPAQIEADPLQPSYGRCRTYWIGGAQVHTSRLVMFNGSPIMQVPGHIMSPHALSEIDGFGDSIIVPIIDDLTRASATRQAALQMIQRNGSVVGYTDLTTLESTKNGSAAIQKLKDVVNQLNLYRGALLHKDPSDPGTPITTLAMPFGSVPELIITSLQVLSAASDIPSMRFLQEAPGGLNSNSDGTLENYYGSLESTQNKDIRPRLNKLLRVLVPSVFGGAIQPDDVQVVFPPLWSMSATEEAAVRTSDANNISVMYTSGLLDEQQALGELVARNVLAIDPNDPATYGGGAPTVGTDAQSQHDAIKQVLDQLVREEGVIV